MTRSITRFLLSTLSRSQTGCHSSLLPSDENHVTAPDHLNFPINWNIFGKILPPIFYDWFDEKLVNMFNFTSLDGWSAFISAISVELGVVSAYFPNSSADICRSFQVQSKSTGNLNN
jgi:hypothetical protein